MLLLPNSILYRDIKLVFFNFDKNLFLLLSKYKTSLLRHTSCIYRKVLFLITHKLFYFKFLTDNAVTDIFNVFRVNT